MKILKQLRKLKNFNIIDFAVPIIDLICPIKGSPNNKYDNKYFLICLINFIETNVSWNKYKGTKEYPINGKYLNQIHNKYQRMDVYEEIEKQLLNKYLKTDKECKLKNQIIDSSFIQNKQGCIKKNNYLLSDKEKYKNETIKKINKTLPKNKQLKKTNFIDFNKYNGRKKYFKIDVITDSYGVPLEHNISSSKISDSITLIKNINNIPINLNTLRNSRVNRYKQYLLADSLYDSKKNKNFLIKNGYIPIIRYNKRNTRNKDILKKNEMSKKHKQIYKRRPIIESFFAWIKNKPIINQNYQKTITSYDGLLSLACSLIISKRI